MEQRKGPRLHLLRPVLFPLLCSFLKCPTCLIWLSGVDRKHKGKGRTLRSKLWLSPLIWDNLYYYCFAWYIHLLLLEPSSWRIHEGQLKPHQLASAGTIMWQSQWERSSVSTLGWCPKWPFQLRFASRMVRRPAYSAICWLDCWALFGCFCWEVIQVMSIRGVAVTCHNCFHPRINACCSVSRYHLKAGAHLKRLVTGYLCPLYSLLLLTMY